MGKLGLDRLEPGMVLAADVHDRAGRFLLGAGAELNAKHLIVFRTWGVDEVDIAGQEDGDELSALPPEVTQEAIDAAEAALAALFANANTAHPAMRELLRLAALRKVLNGAP